MLKNIKLTFAALSFSLVTASSAFAEEAAHHSGGLPQFNPASWPSQIFWLAVFFTILYTVFAKSVLPTMTETIETRKSYIADAVKKAEDLSYEAEKLRREIEASLKTANHAAQAHITEAETLAKSRTASGLTDFRTRYDAAVTAAEQRISEASAAALSDMDKIAADLASAAAEKIAGIPASESGAEHVIKSLTQKAKIAA